MGTRRGLRVLTASTPIHVLTASTRIHVLTASTRIHVLTASLLQVLTASTALSHERESREEVEAEEARLVGAGDLPPSVQRQRALVRLAGRVTRVQARVGRWGGHGGR
jgi:hypothetical protein